MKIILSIIFALSLLSVLAVAHAGIISSARLHEIKQPPLRLAQAEASEKVEEAAEVDEDEGRHEDQTSKEGKHQNEGNGELKDKDKNNGEDKSKDESQESAEIEGGNNVNANGGGANLDRNRCKKKEKDAKILEEFVVTVKNFDGEPVRGATVTLEWETGATPSKKTRSNGIVVFGKIPVSVPYVKIIASSYDTYASCVDLANTGGSQTVTLTKH